MYETINNDIIRKLCRRVYNTVSPFMKEAQGIQWNNFRYRYAVFSLESWGFASLFVGMLQFYMRFVHRIEAKQCL